jgi:methionine transaminase
MLNHSKEYFYSKKTMQFPNKISSKLPLAGTTIFTIMSKLANEQKAINLSQGFPDFDCDQKLIKLVNFYMKKGFNQYAPMAGAPVLREAIADKTKNLYGVYYHPETEITVTSGATQAIYTTITALIKEGDEVIVFSPAYDCYQPAIELAGGKTIYLNLTYPTFFPDWEKLKKLINYKTRLIIINTPHNPSGNVWTKNDFEKFNKIMEEKDIFVLSDEVYEHMVFDQHQHFSACQFSELAKRSIIVNSFGKTFHVTGWKMGYILAPENIMEEIRKVHQFVVFSANTPLQYAFADFLGNEENYKLVSKFYQAKRDFFLDKIDNENLSFIPTPGTYFQLIDYRKISMENDIEIAKQLTIKNKLASIPVSVFYHDQTDNKLLRFCFAKKEKVLEKAAKILNNLPGKL